MATSRKSLRQVLGQDLNECYLGTIAAGTLVTLLYDTALIDPDETESRFDRAWVKIVSGAADGEIRRIRQRDVGAGVYGYNPELGTLQLTRALINLPVADDGYELHTRLDPDDIDTRINRTLNKCYYLEREIINPVAEQREYSLAAYAWLTEEAQVQQVFWRYGDTALEYQYRPMRWWEISEDAGVLTLHVKPYDTDGKYIVEAIRPYAELATDAAETDCPPDWVRAGAEMLLCRFLAEKGPAQDAARLKKREEEARKRFIGLCRRYQPRPRVRIQHPESPWVV